MSNPTPLQGRAAIITGASKGIGEALAIGLSRAGASVAVNYKNDRAGAERTVRTITESGGTAITLGADIGSPPDARHLIERAHAHFGSLDILVNNAGRTRFGPATDVTLEDWDDVVHTNLRGPYFATVAASAAMDDRGSVINISSIAGTLSIPYHGVYTTSKGGLEAMTRQLAYDLAPNIRVNAIAPGPTSIERNREYNRDFDRDWARVIPLRRVATPEDLVAPAVFLASDASAFITGVVLHVDGGWTIQGQYPPNLDRYHFESDRQRDKEK